MPAKNFPNIRRVVFGRARCKSSWREVDICWVRGAEACTWQTLHEASVPVPGPNPSFWTAVALRARQMADVSASNLHRRLPGAKGATMIVFGTRAKMLAMQLINSICPSCEQSSSQAVAIFQRYFHLMWIPTIPLTKRAVVQCQHCKRVLQSGEFTPEIEGAVSGVRNKTRTPIWSVSGLAVIALIVIGFTIKGQRDEANTKAYIAAPAAGDLAVVQTEDGFHPIRVGGTDGLNVQIYASRYVYKTADGAKEDSLQKKDKLDYFNGSAETIPLDRYKALSIRSVVR